MEKFFVPRRAFSLLLLATLLCFLASCRKKNEPAAASPTPNATAYPGPTVAPAITGQMTPAIVTQDATSITHYLHFPNQPTSALASSVVQFYCDVSEKGTVTTTYGVVGKDEAFRAAVQYALDWGHFTPATIEGKPVPVYLGGTVLFFHQNSIPIVAVSLITYDRERVGKLTNYIQPQLVGGLLPRIEKIIRLIPQGAPASGRAEAIINLDERGAVGNTSVAGEDPPGSGLGLLLNDAARGAQYIHAFQDGKPVAGAVNIVADFSKL
jgi:hypothetical protein